MSSDEESSHGDAQSVSSDSGSDSDPSNPRFDENPLLDLEAEGSDEDEEGDEDGSQAEESSEDDEEDYADYYSERSSNSPFHKFMQLPPELRYRIWETFCPDLLARSRVLKFATSPSSAAMHTPNHYSVKDHMSLADQTEPMRRMLAVHKESRAMALKVFPDELSLDSEHGIVRCNKETDVIFLDYFDSNRNYALPNFSAKVQHVAVDVLDSDMMGYVAEAIYKCAEMFPNLKRMYCSSSAVTSKLGALRWCASDLVHAYLVETYEKSPGLGEDTQTVFCYPNVDNHRDYAKYQVPRIEEVGLAVENAVQNSGVEVWPMVSFELDKGMTMYEKLREEKDIPFHGDEDSSDDEEVEENEEGEESGTDLDEYESDGIDDDEIVEVDESSEDEVVPNRISDPARFSSPETISDDSGGVQVIDLEEEDGLARRSRKRKVVSDSDDDEDEEPQVKRVRTSHIVIDSDEEDAAPVRGKDGRRAQVIHDSDSEDDEGDQANDDAESDEEEEEAPTKKMSLAERLRNAREEQPVSSASEDEDDDEDEEEEEDEDEDEDDRGGLLDTMAAEGDDDDEDDEDGW